MKLWVSWYQAISLLRPAFSRQVTFLWFALAVMGISVRRDRLSVHQYRSLTGTQFCQLSLFARSLP